MYNNLLSGAQKQVSGYDLRIDANIQKLCDVSNRSSTNTRWTFYVLLIILLVSVIAIINTFKNLNWTNERIDGSFNELVVLSQKSNESGSDAVPPEKQKVLYELEKNIDSKVHQIRLVEIPFIGNSFDVNNLAIIAGFAFVVCLIVTYFTASREKKNLRIALHAITRRYPAFNDYSCAEAMLMDLYPVGQSNSNEGEQEFNDTTKAAIDNFNRTRRRFHYNYLNMNEVFTVPTDVLKNENAPERKLKKIFFEKLVLRYILYIPFAIYCCIIINDLNSASIGEHLSNRHTCLQFYSSYIFAVLIAYLCLIFNNQKLLTQAYFDHFQENDFIYIYQENVDQHKMRVPVYKWKIKINVLLYPLAFVAIFVWNLVKLLRLIILGVFQWFQKILRITGVLKRNIS